jgi:hypothetical protein
MDDDARSDSRRVRGRGTAPVLLASLLMAGWFAPATSTRAQSFTLSTAVGDLQVPLIHVSPGGKLMPPGTPVAPPFTAPAIFAAPLPSGSGARALGAAGAFTAIADDATAASWNPAGLIQLERPEVSAVFRLKREDDRHSSADAAYRVGTDDHSSYALNYLSAVAPVRILERNAVVSMNLQEVFDFSHRFRAEFEQHTGSHSRRTRRTTASDTVQTHFALENGYIDLTEQLTTMQTTTVRQRQSTTMLGQVDFEQEGGVQALSPAFALELTPKLAVGAAVNVYLTGLTDGQSIRSHTFARYTGTLENRVSLQDVRRTEGTWNYTGMYVSPTVEVPLDPESGEVPPYTTTARDETVARHAFEGFYEVDDRIDDFYGVNATFGALWTASSRLSFGLCLDLPWQANARQTKTIRSGVQVEGRPAESDQTVVAKDVTFDFPLYWAAGAAWRWTDRLTSSLDVSQTLWSDYVYHAEGDPRRNPLDGSSYGEHPVDDCWAARTGLEYLWVLTRTEIPFRVGLSCEQRPAVGSPDTYGGVSLGSGISLGQGANKVILDVAYVFTWGRDVMGTLVPGQTGSLETDVNRHDLFISCIYHF